jgi:hypothetical protein
VHPSDTMLALAGGHLPGHRTAVAVAEGNLGRAIGPSMILPACASAESEASLRLRRVSRRQLQSAMLKAWQSTFQMLQ